MNDEAKRLATALHRIKVAVGNTSLTADEAADMVERMAHQNKVMEHQLEQARRMAKDARSAVE